jgi:hypothetical protein
VTFAVEIVAKPFLSRLGYGGRNGVVDIYDDKILVRIALR